MCARVGCMPSKALIQVAGEFHRRRLFAGAGITGSGQLACDIPAVLRHVRRLRDRFTEAMSDPEVNATIRKAMAAEYPLPLGTPAEVEPDGNALLVRSGNAAQKLHAGDGPPAPALCRSCPEAPLC